MVADISYWIHLTDYFCNFSRKIPTMDILSDPAVIWFLIGLGLLLLELGPARSGNSVFWGWEPG